MCSPEIYMPHFSKIVLILNNRENFHLGRVEKLPLSCLNNRKACIQTIGNLVKFLPV